MGKKTGNLLKIIEDFQKKMQKICDDSKDVTEISIQIKDKPPVVIAHKNKKQGQ